MIAFRCVRKKNRSHLRYYDVLSVSCVSQVLAAMREGGDFLRSELGAVATRFGGMLAAKSVLLLAPACSCQRPAGENLAGC